jgi:hypothetical protein
LLSLKYQFYYHLLKEEEKEKNLTKSARITVFTLTQLRCRSNYPNKQVLDVRK